mmetsp:Transcript_59748/g.177787  ORF Transcript_59748/g.177787 Transcript_59748/m.177787 type:complete len:273 (-) Transcript_59748:689-1507(-)
MAVRNCQCPNLRCHGYPPHCRPAATPLLCVLHMRSLPGSLAQEADRSATAGARQRTPHSWPPAPAWPAASPPAHGCASGASSLPLEHPLRHRPAAAHRRWRALPPWTPPASWPPRAPGSPRPGGRSAQPRAHCCLPGAALARRPRRLQRTPCSPQPPGGVGPRRPYPRRGRCADRPLQETCAARPGRSPQGAAALARKPRAAPVHRPGGPGTLPATPRVPTATGALPRRGRPSGAAVPSAEIAPCSGHQGCRRACHPTSFRPPASSCSPSGP